MADAPKDRVSVRVHNTVVNGFHHSASGLENFLGIQFATIPARFRQAVPVDYSKEGSVVDATRYGPQCPQAVDPFVAHRKHVFEGLESGGDPRESEFDCLTLNVYAPPRAENSTANLPVLVWIHGGGWVLGDANSDHAGNALIAHATSHNRPFVYVSVSYRLGYFGFLASEELRAEAKSHGEAGFSNQGLNDQRLGLQWVQNHIQVFGGDPGNITLMGESAGAGSVLSHLESDVPVCQNAIIISAPALSMKSKASAQQSFDRLVNLAGIPASASASAKLEKLRGLTTDQLQSFIESPIGREIWDEKWFVGADPSMLIIEPNRLPSWAKHVVFGFLKDEAAALLPLWAAVPAPQAVQVVRSVIPDQNFASKVLEEYGINEESQPKTLSGVLKLATDTLYTGLLPRPGVPAPHSLYTYTFDQVESFSGALFEGYAHHGSSNAFIFRYPSVAGPKASPAQRATCDAFSKLCTDLLYGEEPWEPYHISGQGMSFDGDKSGLVKLSFPWFKIVSDDEDRKTFQAIGEGLLDFAMSSMPHA